MLRDKRVTVENMKVVEKLPRSKSLFPDDPRVCATLTTTTFIF